MDKLTTMMGCNVGALLNTLSLLLCSTTTEKPFHSAVHSPTEMVISQMKHEMDLGSITSPVALNHLTQAISTLESVVQSDKLLGATSQDSETPNINQLMLSMNDLVNNFDNNEKKQRQLVEMASELSGQRVEPQETVLERPPLASQVEQERRKRAVPADNVLNDIKSPECALAKLATTLCSPTDTTKALTNLVSLFTTSLTELELTRHTLLNEILQPQATSTPAVTGNQLAWASLGNSERTILSILKTVLNAAKLAQEQQDKDTNEDQSLQKLDADMTALLSDFPGLLGSSMGQLSDAAGGMSSSMGQLAKPVGNQKRQGIFSFFGK